MQLFINREKPLVDFAAFAAGLLANINILDFHTHTHKLHCLHVHARTCECTRLRAHTCAVCVKCALSHGGR